MVTQKNVVEEDTHTREAVEVVGGGVGWSTNGERDKTITSICAERERERERERVSIYHWYRYNAEEFV
jgi:hypothetical protein